MLINELLLLVPLFRTCALKSAAFAQGCKHRVNLNMSVKFFEKKKGNKTKQLNRGVVFCRNVGWVQMANGCKMFRLFFVIISNGCSIIFYDPCISLVPIKWKNHVDDSFLSILFFIFPCPRSVIRAHSPPPLPPSLPSCHLIPISCV